MTTPSHSSKGLIGVRLNLSREEYAAFRHYCIDRGESGASILSGYIRKLVGREKRGQSDPGITEDQAGGESE